jgi:membrane protein DedA with SNARE-associated domain
MFEALLMFFQGSPLALWGLFLAVILCGMGLPIPEDIILITAGMISQDSGHSWIVTSVLMFCGVMLGDTAVFLLGRHFGGRLLTLRWTHRMFSPTKQAKIERYFERYGTMVLFVARFLPGLRAPIYASAGAMKVPYRKFALLDGLAALISVPAFVWLGDWLWKRFHEDLETLGEVLAQTHTYTLWGTLVLVVLLGTGLWLRFRRRSSAPPVGDR